MRNARLLVAIGAAVATFGCRGEAPAAGGGMTLALPAVAAGLPIPTRFTCDGANLSPAVQWRDVPAATRSLALVVDDPDAPGGTFAHWGVFNLDAPGGQLPEGAGNDASSRFRQARNDFGQAGYGGPCPPRGNGAHHYRFRLFALDSPTLAAGSAVRVGDLEPAMDGHVLASALVTATYERR